MMDFLRGGRRRLREAAGSLYSAAVNQARQPRFYAELAVEDSLDGRFDLLALHCFLIMKRLKDGKAHELSQALFDVMFADMDQNLRELGASDMSVGAKVKTMARAFMGRVAAYDAALADVSALEGALARNLYRGRDVDGASVSALARYVMAEADHLSGQGMDLLEGGTVTFLPLERE